MAPTKVEHHKAIRFNTSIQVEKAYQRQSGANENARFSTAARKSGNTRYWKSVGLGFKTPKDAIMGKYIDKKCPFTGNVSIRGRVLRGICHSNKMQRTIVVRRNYLHFVNKYQRYQKRHRNIAAHCSPAFLPKIGDDIVMGQCRPLSKTCLLYTSPSPRDS
eukprot:TRINITY_DN1883_c0_g1_i9.p1 TRINITY_DN1883_c0_g1~~TRINITY_DN1883_c0_g1_i9.p1  ORF type:complete len:161 (-),score=57.97 TRINITY_DN1883_c0_g1_i9:107-589(-)